MLDVYVLKTKANATIVDRINEYGIYKVRETPTMEVTSELLHEIAQSTSTKFFYILKITEVSNDFDLSYVPPEWDKDYLHVMGNGDKIRLYNTENVLKKPHKYSDAFITAGYCKLKQIQQIPTKTLEYPIIFLSYDEIFADENFARLKGRFPRALRVQKIEGIFNAHKEAARLADLMGADMFFVVDADAIIEPTFKFTYTPSVYDINSVHVWHSRNPVNGLEYGYGGVKLFPTEPLLKAEAWGIDFTTTVSNSLKVIPEVSNVTAFNTDPFSAWKSAFRECVKLSASCIPNEDSDTRARLETWCTVGEDMPYGDFVLMGANEGREYGETNKDNFEAISFINDFIWLEERFSS